MRGCQVEDVIGRNEEDRFLLLSKFLCRLICHTRDAAGGFRAERVVVALSTTMYYLHSRSSISIPDRRTFFSLSFERS